VELEEAPQLVLLQGLLGVLVVGVRGLLPLQTLEAQGLLGKVIMVEMDKMALNMCLGAVAVRAR
jgi:hypothetical protein